MEQSKNILDLNFDVLVLIFAQLDEIEDQLNFARVHPTFGEAFAYANRKKFREVDDGTLDRLEDWPFFLSLCGENVTEFRVTELFEELAEILPKICPNIEFLQLQHPFDEYKINLLPRLKSLNELEIGSLGHNGNRILASLQQFPNLRTITLWAPSREAITNPPNLVQVTKLRLFHCRRSGALNICKFMPNLRSLHLSIFYLKMLGELAVQCSLLEELILEDMPDLEQMPYFPKLKCLYVLNAPESLLTSLANRCEYQNQLQQLTVINNIHNGFDWNSVGQLRALKELQCIIGCDGKGLKNITQLKELERLSISNSHNITGGALLNVLRECKKLRCLDIQNCLTIKNDFVFAALKILEENGVQPEKPFILMAYQTDIDPTINKELGLKQAGKLLDIRFDKSDFFVSHIPLRDFKNYFINDL